MRKTKLNILITNDDGYKAEGIRILSRMMTQFGNVMVVAPKRHQSGMGMAVDLGLKRIAYKHIGSMEGADWSYLDATPASCVKYGLNYPVFGKKPDVVVAGINHGSNATTGSCYSGTLGAAMEGALNGIPSMGVSLCDFRPGADFSAVEKIFPSIFSKLMESSPDHAGIVWNINFPAVPEKVIKGVRIAHQGRGHWEKEFVPWDPSFYAKEGISLETFGRSSGTPPEEGEELLMMTGVYVDDENSPGADHHLIKDGYVTIVPHNLYNTDYEEMERLNAEGFNVDFKQ